ncbi:MAG: hypothetical protein CR961_00385 [Polaribacter sp.]|nr:MAG: hypothetical protein CR961_00385 [Polaribacter sp.]
MLKKLNKKVLLVIIVLLPLNLILWNLLFIKKTFTFITDLSNGLINPTFIAGLFSLFLYLFFGVVIGGLRIKDFLLDKEKIKKGLLMIFVLWGIGNLLGAFLSFFQTGNLVFVDKITYHIGNFMGQLFGNALAEEVLFRGILLTQFYLILRTKFKNKKSVLWALITSQLIFSLNHIPNRIILEQTEYLIFDLIKLFVVGVIISLMFMKTQNLVYVVSVHSLLNSPLCLFKADQSFIILAILVLSIIITIFWYKIGMKKEKNWFKEGLV